MLMYSGYRLTAFAGVFYFMDKKVYIVWKDGETYKSYIAYVVKRGFMFSTMCYLDPNGFWQTESFPNNKISSQC